ncbi:MAG: hypothetical protein ABUK20_13555 [Anaerolineales bacterium]
MTTDKTNRTITHEVEIQDALDDVARDIALMKPDPWWQLNENENLF